MKKVTTKEAENSYFKRSIPCKGALNRHIYHIFRSTVRTLKNTIARLWDGYLLIFVKADLLLKEVFETCDELSLEIERQNVETCDSDAYMEVAASNSLSEVRRVQDEDCLFPLLSTLLRQDAVLTF